MRETDKDSFTAMIVKSWRFYGKAIIGEEVNNWFQLLEPYPLDILSHAFQQHLTDPQRGQYLPKPADIVRLLPASTSEYPTADEAWGQVVRLINDEAETGVLTKEMRLAWQACQPILDIGDGVGARRCFIDRYNNAVQVARAENRPIHWTPTLGTDPQLRKIRLEEAHQLGRVNQAYLQQYTQGLLSAPEADIPRLEHDQSEPDPQIFDGIDPTLDIHQKIHELAQRLRSRANGERSLSPAQQEAQAQRQREQAKKREMAEWLEQLEAVESEPPQAVTS